jgi:hypothetical protein
VIAVIALIAVIARDRKSPRRHGDTEEKEGKSEFCFSSRLALYFLYPLRSKGFCFAISASPAFF